MSPSDAPEKFVAPEVLLGDTVYWKHSPSDGEEAAALVVKVGTSGTISVMVHGPDSARPIPKDGVIHRYDPRVKARETDSGVWYHTPRTQRMNRVLELVAELDAKCDDLDERVMSQHDELRGNA